MKKARLIISYMCKRQCVGCCNRHYEGPDPIKIKYVDSLRGYDEVCISGGEPLLFPKQTLHAIHRLREISPKTKIYVYTAAVDRPEPLAWVTYLADGITLSIHTQQDLITFRQTIPWGGILGIEGKSMRMKIFEGVTVPQDLDLTGWQVDFRVKWLAHCPLPKDETLFDWESPVLLEKFVRTD